nr:MAG: hypothetical protein DIU58_01085 [Sphaerobacter thermophilus]
MAQTITPCLWFNGQAEEATNFYLSVFPNSEVLNVTRYTEVGPGEPGSVVTISFQLNGQEYLALNGGPEFKFNEAVSFIIDCATQEEVDHYWEKLTADGGEPGPCGWLKDKFGVSWQVVPSILDEYLRDEDRERANRVMETMLKMSKLDIAELQRAYEGR